MTTSHAIERHATELLAAARAFQSETEHSGSYVAAPDALVSLEEALQALSAAWYQLAADAVPRAVDAKGVRAAARDVEDGLSREAEVQLVGTLHDVAAGFARCARTCRESRRRAEPIIARAAATRHAQDRDPSEASVTLRRCALADRSRRVRRRSDRRLLRPPTDPRTGRPAPS